MNHGGSTHPGSPDSQGMNRFHSRLCGSVILVAMLCGAGCQDRAISLAMDGGVKYEEISEGEGTAATDGMLVGVGYKVLLPDGKVIIDTFEQKKMHRFVVGDGTVIPGLDIGVRGMKKGGVRTLTVPPRSHYGKHGYGDVIPPNTTLTFELHMTEISPAGAYPETTVERHLRKTRG